MDEVTSRAEETFSPIGWMFSFFGNMIWVGVTILILLWLSKKVRRRMRQTLDRRSPDTNLSLIIDNIIKIVVFLVIGLMALGALTGETGSTVTAIGLITAAVSLSLQDVLRNFAAGIFLLAEQPFKVGDTIQVVNQTGEVEKIDIRTTRLRNANNEEVFVPNYKVFSEVLQNRRHLDPHVFRIKSAAGASETRQAIEAVLADYPTVDGKRPVVELSSMHADSSEFKIRLWNEPGNDDHLAILTELVNRLPDSEIIRVEQ